MTKNQYFSTGLSALFAFLMLIVMKFTWPDLDFYLNDLILENVEIGSLEKDRLLNSLAMNYALDTLFIFAWIGAWIGLYEHYKKQYYSCALLSFILSCSGALLDLLENSILFSLLTGGFLNVERILVYHTIIRDLSFWLPMLAAFVLVLPIRISGQFPNLCLKLAGIAGVGLSVLGMYLPALAVVPYFWFIFLFLTATIVLLDSFRKYDNSP